MRGPHFLVAALLTAGAVSLPIAGSAGLLSFADGVEGKAAFPEAGYEANVTIASSDAGLRLLGPVQATAYAANVTVTVYDYTEHRATVHLPGGGGATAAYRAESDVDRERFSDASVRVAGRAETRLHAWPNATLGRASFELSLANASQGSIDPSQSSADLQVAWWQFAREFDAPVIGFEDGAELDGSQGGAQLPSASFSRFGASGGLDIIVQNATILVEDGGDEHTFVADSNLEPAGPHGVPGSADASTDHRRIVVLSIVADNLTVPFVEARGVFVANRPVVDVNGTTTFQAHSGRLEASDGRTRSLADDPVLIEGNTTLDLWAEGTDEDAPLPAPFDDHGRPHETLPEPLMHAGIDSNASTVRVEGNAWGIPTEPAIPEEATWLGRVLGVLLVAWAAGKKIAPPAVGLFARNPLDNDTRRAIYEYVEENGLAYLRELADQLGLNNSTAEYHLRVLERSSLLTSVDEGGYRVFFLQGGEFDHHECRRLAVLANPTRREIARLVGSGEVRSQKTLADRLDVHHSTVSRHLSSLEAAGLVERHGTQDFVYESSRLLGEWLERAGSLGG